MDTTRRQDKALADQFEAAQMRFRTRLPLHVVNSEYGIPTRIHLCSDEDGTWFLDWGYQDITVDCRTVDPSVSVLERFIRLHDAENEPERIRAFAQEHGVLGVCPHRRDEASSWWFGLPDCPECIPGPDDLPGVSQRELIQRVKLVGLGRAMLVSGNTPALQDFVRYGHAIDGDSEFVTDSLSLALTLEPVDAWVEWAKELRAILKAMAKVQVGLPVDHEDWRLVHRLTGWELLDQAFGLERHVEHPLVQLQAVHQAATYWIAANADLDVQVAWFASSVTRRGAPWSRCVLVANNLRNRLAVELADMLCSPAGIYACDSCYEPYRPVARRPKSGQRRFCPACRAEGYLKARRERARSLYRQKHPHVKRLSKNSTQSPVAHADRDDN